MARLHEQHLDSWQKYWAGINGNTSQSSSGGDGNPAGLVFLGEAGYLACAVAGKVFNLPMSFDYVMGRPFTSFGILIATTVAYALLLYRVPILRWVSFLFFLPLMAKGIYDFCVWGGLLHFDHVSFYLTVLFGFVVPVALMWGARVILDA